MIWRQIAAVALLLCLTASVGGCWNLREPEDLVHVLGLALDLDEESGLFKVYAQVANPAGMGGAATPSGDAGGTGGGGGKKPFWTVSAYGHTPFEAVRNLVPHTSRELFWSHTSVLVISEKLARRGILPIIDFFERERQTRMIVRPVVAEGDVGRLMEADFPLEQTGARALSRGIMVSMFQSSIFPAKLLTEVVDTLSEPGVEVLIGRVKVLAEERTKSAAPSQAGAPRQPGALEPPAELSGAAAFHKDRMVGWFSEREVRGWHWITGRAFRATLVLSAPDDEEKLLTVEVTSSSAKIEPGVEGNDARMKVTVKAEGRVQDETGPEDLTTESELTRSLNRRMAQVIRSDMEMAIAKAKELRSDVFGFGYSIYRTRYKDWKRLEEHWDEIFPTMPVELHVEARIRRTGLITKSATVR